MLRLLTLGLRMRLLWRALGLSPRRFRPGLLRPLLGHGPLRCDVLRLWLRFRPLRLRSRPGGLGSLRLNLLWPFRLRSGSRRLTRLRPSTLLRHRRRLLRHRRTLLRHGRRLLRHGRTLLFLGLAALAALCRLAVGFWTIGLAWAGLRRLRLLLRPELLLSLRRLLIAALGLGRLISSLRRRHRLGASLKLLLLGRERRLRLVPDRSRRAHVAIGGQGLAYRHQRAGVGLPPPSAAGRD
jgi:hypothetical protein